MNEDEILSESEIIRRILDLAEDIARGKMVVSIYKVEDIEDHYEQPSIIGYIGMHVRDESDYIKEIEVVLEDVRLDPVWAYVWERYYSPSWEILSVGKTWVYHHLAEDEQLREIDWEDLPKNMRKAIDIRISDWFEDWIHRMYFE